MKKKFYILGMIAFVTYISSVIIGGLLIPNYSHINQAISEIEPLLGSSSNRYLITGLFTLYNVSALLLGILLFSLLRNRGKKYQVQVLSIFLISLFGLLMYFFPMDIVGEPVTVIGIIHIVLAGLMAPLTIVAVGLGYWTFKDNNKMRWYALISSIFILISGGISAYFTANGMHLMGLFERITIGLYIIFLLMISLYWHKYLKKEQS